MNRNHARGMRWEAAVRDYLREAHGRAVVRPRQEHTDVGDLHLSPWALQCKDTQALTFSSFVDDAEAQAAAAGESYGAAVVKRRGKNVSRAYVVMSLEAFTQVVGEVRAARAADLSE